MNAPLHVSTLGRDGRTHVLFTAGHPCSVYPRRRTGSEPSSRMYLGGDQENICHNENWVTQSVN